MCLLALFVSPVSASPLSEKKKNLHSFGDEKMHSVSLSMSYSQLRLDRISAQLLKADLAPFAIFPLMLYDVF